MKPTFPDIRHEGVTPFIPAIPEASGSEAVDRAFKNDGGKAFGRRIGLGLLYFQYVGANPYLIPGLRLVVLQFPISTVCILS